MALEITVPVLGESVTEATVAKWLKKVGDAVALDEPLLELETDKVTLEVNATQAGTLAEIVAGEGDTVEVGALLGTLSDGAGAPAAKPAPKAEAAPAPAPAPAPAAPAAAPAATQHDTLSPAVRKLGRRAQPCGIVR
jgi:2-oxoglutarate dehydrogenase E2 component (dihydrolipoamide succinyltransferase)